MSLLRNLILSCRFHSLLNPKNPYTLHPTTPPHSPKFKIPHRPIASLPQTQKDQNKKPLSAFFIETVGLSERTAISTEEGERGDTELKKKPRQLTEQVRSFKEKTKRVPKKSERRSLYAVFTNQPASVTVRTQKQKEEKLLMEQVDVKKLSPDVVMFAQFLYQKGYFKDANFVKNNQRFDLAWFESYFARGYIKFAAKKFAIDNQEIANQGKQ